MSFWKKKSFKQLLFTTLLVIAVFLGILVLYRISKPRTTVVKVVDGDTVDILIDNKSQPVRLIGIDAPEYLYGPKGARCFGRESWAKAQEILGGKKISLESDAPQGDKDKFGRVLRYIILPDGTNFNLLMIREGFAREYTYEGKVYKYQQQFRDAQTEAKNNKRGLWGGCSLN